MNDVIGEIGILAGGSHMRRIYEKLQISGDKVYKEAGLHFKSSWFPVYYTLVKSGKPQTITAIADQISFTHITVKNVLKGLERENLINIIPNPDDGRSKLVTLSTKGNRQLKKLEPLWSSFEIALEEVFSSGHPDMTEILTKIDMALEKESLHKRVKKVQSKYIVRSAKDSEFKAIGKLMVQVYSQLPGFPTPKEQPAYYSKLHNIGELAKSDGTELLVAVTVGGKIGGAVVYFNDMQYYGSGGSATAEKNASGFRLLAVAEPARGMGLGKMLSNACIKKAQDDRNSQLIIHTTKAMQVAWKMYENLGFKRDEELDFLQGKLPVYGFRYKF